MSKEKKSLKLEIEFRLSNKDNDEYDDFEDDTLGIDEDFEELEMKHWTIQPPAAEDMGKGAKPGAAPPCGSACC